MNIKSYREQYFERSHMLFESQGKSSSEFGVESTIHESVHYLRIYYNKGTITLSDLAEWKVIAHFTDLCGYEEEDSKQECDFL